MPARWVLAAVTALLFANKARPAGAVRSDALAFVVSARQPVRTLPAADLRQIFLGRITRWKSGRRILLAVRPETTGAGRAFFDRVVQVSDIDFSRLWLGIIFRGEAMSSPRVLKSGDDVQRFLARSPDALSFALESELGSGDSIRPLLIDGALPEDVSYPFRIPK